MSVGGERGGGGQINCPEAPRNPFSPFARESSPNRYLVFPCSKTLHVFLAVDSADLESTSGRSCATPEDTLGRRAAADQNALGTPPKPSR